MYDKCLQITTADGKPQSCLAYIEVPLMISGIRKDIKILDIPSVTNTLILGMDFFKLFAANFVSFKYAVSHDISVVNTTQHFSSLNDVQNQIAWVVHM